MKRFIIAGCLCLGLGQTAWAQGEQHQHDMTGMAPKEVGTVNFETSCNPAVKVKFNGIPYTGSLFKYGHPLHMLPMLKAIREQTGTSLGDTVEVDLWKDTEPRTVEAPAQFKEAMEREGVAPLFDGLSYSHRKEYCQWIAEAKTEKTRLRRVEKAVEMIKKGAKSPDDASSPTHRR